MKELPMRGFLSKLKVRFLGLKRWQQIVVVVGVLLFMFAPVGANQESDNETGAVPTPVASGKPTPTPSSTPVATPSSTPAPSASALPADRCVKVSQKKLNKIAEWLTVSGGGSLSNGYAVESNDFESLWFIAATINGPQMGNKTIGIWSANTLEPVSGNILSVDAFAAEFSGWVVGSTTSANITQYDDGAQEAAQCAGKP
jgi:hypothetical protein